MAAMTSILSPLRAEFEQLWRSRVEPPDGAAPPRAATPPAAPASAPSRPAAFVHFDPSIVATVAQFTSATRAAASSAGAFAAGALQSGSRATLLRATAATGASIASTAVSLAALDASILAGATLAPDADAAGGAPLGDHAAAFAAAAPASAADDARVTAFAAAHPDVALPALLQYAATGSDRASALVAGMGAGGPAVTAPLAAARAAMTDAARAVDDRLVTLLRARSLHAVSDVIDLMRAVDALLPDGDGLKAFNLLYRMVTESVGAATAWEDTAWILGLDVIFADLYFDGIERALATPDTAPAAWRALLDRRGKPGIAPIQFALAGMNAHINRDLAVAVARTWVAMGPADHGRSTPEFRDYVAINDVLDAIEPQAMAQLATGLFKLADALLEPADGWVAMQVIHAARDLAWTHAVNLAALGIDTDAARAYVAALDAVAADVAAAALVPIP